MRDDRGDDLPRHRCRGLIEAAAVDPSAAIDIIFRGIDAAASLKPSTPICATCGAVIFRGIDAAASLKRASCADVRCRQLPIFRGIDAAASLKRVRIVASRSAPSTDLPRHRCRGLIEARLDRAVARRLRHLPRHRCRGLIEALDESRRRCPRRDRDLPRHRCRGLIEAASDYGNLPDRVDTIFRGIDAAASLKRASRPSEAA